MGDSTGCVRTYCCHFNSDSPCKLLSKHCPQENAITCKCIEDCIVVIDIFKPLQN